MAQPTYSADCTHTPTSRRGLLSKNADADLLAACDQFHRLNQPVTDARTDDALGAAMNAMNARQDHVEQICSMPAYTASGLRTKAAIATLLHEECHRTGQIRKELDQAHGWACVYPEFCPCYLNLRCDMPDSLLGISTHQHPLKLEADLINTAKPPHCNKSLCMCMLPHAA
jgi:hypothetical protein